MGFETMTKEKEKSGLSFEVSLWDLKLVTGDDTPKHVEFEVSLWDLKP